MTRVAIVASHPIQYQVPWFQRLQRRPEVDLTVYFGMLPDAVQQGVGFGVAFQWDIPLLEGYRWKVLENVARRPAVDQFWGCHTPGISSELRRERFDAVVITGWHLRMMWQALGASRRARVPALVRGESNCLRKRPRWVRWVHRRLLARYDAYLAIGKGNREFYLRNGAAPERIFWAPYFVDNERFRAAAAALCRVDLRRRWNIPEDAVCFLYAGKLEPKKRIIDLLAALKRAAGVRPAGLHVLIAGAGALEAEARQIVDEARLPVTFAGFLNQSEMPGAYEAADCLVLPSDYGETWGLVVNEAMACSRPAVVSDRVGCGPDLVESGVTGRIFPFGDIAALARDMIELSGDRERLVEMGCRAAGRVGSYSADEAAAGTVAAIQAVTA